MENMGLDGAGGEGGVGGVGGVGGIGGGGSGGKKGEMLMREARYGVGSVLVEEGAPSTMIYVIVEGECRIMKGKPRSQISGEKLGFKRYILPSAAMAIASSGCPQVWLSLRNLFYLFHSNNAH